MKDKIYYFQEKSNDILDLQDEFTPEEIGIYFILKAAYFKYSGELREDNLCQRCKFFGDKDKLVAVSKKIFTVTEGSLVNNSWLSEINNIKERSKKRQDAANERWNPSKPEASGKQTRSKPEAIDDTKSQFESFWNLYGKKLSRPDAEKKFKAALNKDSFENIIAGLEKYIKARSPDSQYWKNPSTWLNQECWKDDYSQVTRPTQFANKEVQRQQSNIEASKRFLELSGGDDAF
jgi:uncharacterized protein YdaU (DUF1376 family)